MRAVVSSCAPAAAILIATLAPALAKTPGQTYCFHNICHRVLTIEETKRVVGRTETVLASFYDHPSVDKGNPGAFTSSGEKVDGRSDRTAASPIYPNGTRLLVWNPRTRAAAEVRVTNSGPYHGARMLDVSSGAAEKLGFRPFGVSQLKVTVLSAPTEEEARYIKGRSYIPVAGYLGVFEEAALAQIASARGVPAGVAPIHTASVGWISAVKPVRPPLQRTVAATGWTTTVIMPRPGGPVPPTKAPLRSSLQP